MRRVLVALLFLSVIPVVGAADEKAASSHYKAAEQLLTLMDTPNVLRQSIDQMVKIQAQQNPAIAPYEGVMKEFLGKYMSWDTLKVDLINLYMGEFSEVELGEMGKFYQTPVGKKMVEKLPALMTKGAQMGAQRVQEHMPELQAAIAAEEKKKQEAEPKKK
jgi:uncharacterized protein